MSDQLNTIKSQCEAIEASATAMQLHIDAQVIAAGNDAVTIERLEHEVVDLKTKLAAPTDRTTVLPSGVYQVWVHDERRVVTGPMELQRLLDGGVVAERWPLNGLVTPSPTTDPTPDPELGFSVAAPQVAPFQATAWPRDGASLKSVARTASAHIRLNAGTYTLDALDLAQGVQIVGAGLGQTTIELTGDWSSLVPTAGNRVAGLTITDHGRDAAILDGGRTVTDFLLELVRITRGSPSGVFGAFTRAAFIDCVLAQADQHLLYLRNCTDVRIEGCRMGDAGTTGVKLVASGGSVNRVLIRNNVFTAGNVFQHIGAKINGDWNKNSGGIAARAQELFNIAIVGNRIESVVRASAAFEIDHTDGLTIRGNTTTTTQPIWNGTGNTNVQE
jgi:hypothetical protein